MACVIVPTGCGRVWLETRSDVSVLSGPQPRGYQGNVNITPVRTDKGVWVASDTFPLLILPPTIGQVVCYPGSTWIFSASRDKTVLMWDLNQGDEPIQEFCGHELVVNGVAISPGTHRHTDFAHLPQSHLSWIAMTSCCVLPSVPCESVYWVLQMGESCAPVHVTTGCACGTSNLQNANTDATFPETWWVCRSGWCCFDGMAPRSCTLGAYLTT